MLAGEREHKAGNSKLLFQSGEMSSWDMASLDPSHTAGHSFSVGLLQGKTWVEGGGITRLGANMCILFMELRLFAKLE